MASKGVLRIKIAGDTGPLEKSLDKATGVLKGFATAGVGIFAGLGVAAGAVLVKGIGDAMEKGRLQDRLGAQLALTEDEAEKAGQIAGDLYADAYGDSLAQVHDAVGAVMSSLGDLDDGEVEDLTAKALDLAAAFDVDVNESVAAAGVLMRQGLARDGDHAFDLITRSMQKVPQAMRGELIPIIEEYSQDFAALGIDGEDAFGLLVDAAQDGRIELDKTGDAIKELTIRSTDMSTASVAAYDALGLNAEEMANKIAQGGETARGAFDQIVTGLLDIKDPADRANTAIALMGTPLEDLSVTEIPAFLERLANMDTSLGDVEGAATQMGDQLNDNVATKIEGFKRKAGQAIQDWAYVNVLPAAQEVMEAFEEDGVGGAIDRAIELWEEAQPRINAWWTGTFVPWWENTAVPWGSYIGGEIGVALINALVDVVVNSWQKVNEAFLSMMSNATRNIPGLPSFISGPLGDFLQSGGEAIGGAQIDAPNISNPVSRPGGSSSFGGTAGPGGRFHTGGIITSALPRDPDLRPDERRIIGQVGERVQTVEQQRRQSGDVIQNFYGPVTEQLTGRAAALALRMA